MLNAALASKPRAVAAASSDRTTSILAVAGAHPGNLYSQAELLGAIRTYWGAQHHNPARLESLHRSVCVGERYLALPIDEYPKLRGFGDANDAYVRVGTDVAAEALASALAKAGLEPADVDSVLCTSV